MLLFSACSSNTAKYAYGSEKIIDIVDKHSYLESLLKGHKNKDVVIYKIDPCTETHMQQAYFTVTYRWENNELKDNKDFGIIVSEEFDKAMYKWVNDSTLKVKMYNSSNNLSFCFCQRLGKRIQKLSYEPYN